MHIWYGKNKKSALQLSKFPLEFSCPACFIKYFRLTYRERMMREIAK